MRKAEIANEEKFVNLLVKELACTTSIIWEAVEWWKNKVEFKRPLDQDDQKAWRMIKQRAGTQSTNIPRNPN